MSKIVNKTWLTANRGIVIGIIKCYDEITKETKFYVGVGDGFNEEIDTESIHKHGAKLPLDILGLKEKKND